MVLQKRLERKTASLLLYALQIASSNLKRMELEKPQPEQVVTDLETIDPDTVLQTPMPDSGETARATSASATIDGDEDLPPGTIQACYRPSPQMQNRQSQRHQRQKQRTIQ
jgi:hypothetical protein